MKKHGDVNDQARLNEICHTASLWHIYWDQFSNGSKHSNPTMHKLDQIEREDFGWQQVLDWGLC